MGLSNISEVVREIRVKVVTPPCVPGFRSFGPIPRASSEGFLDTFTPGRVRVTFDYRLFSEYFGYGFHLSRNGLRPSLEPDESGRSPSQRTNHASQGTRNGIRDQPRLDVIPWPFYWGEALRLNVMNSSSMGILESLNPTDEALRKGRNTKESRTRGDYLSSSRVSGQLRSCS